MSAGVARVFKHKFGKLVVSERIGSHLTCQASGGGATVYGFVTKDKYNQKPKVTDYEHAFVQLTQDFIKQKLNTRFSPPMGCIRDQPLTTFIDNIIKFKKPTGAKVKIITYNEQSSRGLRNGLSYDKFVEQLRQSLYDQSTHFNAGQYAFYLTTSDEIAADKATVNYSETCLSHPLLSQSYATVFS